MRGGACPEKVCVWGGGGGTPSSYPALTPLTDLPSLLHPCILILASWHSSFVRSCLENVV